MTKADIGGVSSAKIPQLNDSPQNDVFSLYW